MHRQKKDARKQVQIILGAVWGQDVGGKKHSLKKSSQPWPGQELWGHTVGSELHGAARRALLAATRPGPPPLLSTQFLPLVSVIVGSKPKRQFFRFYIDATNTWWHKGMQLHWNQRTWTFCKRLF